MQAGGFLCSVKWTRCAGSFRSNKFSRLLSFKLCFQGCGLHAVCLGMQLSSGQDHAGPTGGQGAKGDEKVKREEALK